MAFFDLMENFFFISLGITFGLILLLVYHFKQRISCVERRGDTMFELLTNVVKELQFIKSLNSYYESVFQKSAEPSAEPSVQKVIPEIDLCMFRPPESVEKKVIDLPVLNTVSKILVSDDSQSEWSESDSEEGSESELESELESDDESDNESETDLEKIHIDLGEEVVDVSVEPIPEVVSVEPIPEVVSVEPIPEVVSVEPIPEVVSVEPIPEVVVESVVPEIQPVEIVSDVVLEDVVMEPVVHESAPEVVPEFAEPTREQKRDIYRKMNITQLRGMASAAGISTDTTKLKKAEIIKLLENLDE